MTLKRIQRQVLKELPFLRHNKLFLWVSSKKRRALLSELTKLLIIDSGSENLGEKHTPYVILNDGTKLYGIWPNMYERELYHFWRNHFNPLITEDAFRVAIDIIYRYLYPHSMPYLTMPYSRKERRCFHSQHVETIDDMTKLSLQQKEILKKKFSLEKGESVLDIGAYIGFGTVRVAQQLGSTSRVYAVEADPDALWLLKKNVACNNLSNVTIIQKAIWNREGTFSLYKGQRQGNSLVGKIVQTSNVLPVETTTVDAILKNIENSHVDFISLTVNGAEIEAIEGMRYTLKYCKPLRLSIAGWYKRDNQRICDIISPILAEYGFKIVCGRRGGMLAWK